MRVTWVPTIDGEAPSIEGLTAFRDRHPTDRIPDGAYVEVIIRRDGRDDEVIPGRVEWIGENDIEAPSCPRCGLPCFEVPVPAEPGDPSWVWGHDCDP